jgi:thiamine transport system substrate-binding protein
MVRRMSVVLGLLALLVGCSAAPTAPAAAPTTVPAAPTAAPAAASTTVPAAPTAAPAADSGERVVLLTHDSFSVSEAVLAAFTAETGITVEVLRAGDAGGALNQAILSKAAPVADVIFGIDNSFMGRALAADILLPYDAPALASLPAELKLDADNRLLPVDVGYVTFNLDKDAEMTPPADLRELTAEQWRGKVVVQNPASSSPGLSFLIATVAYFGEEGDYTWRDFWRDLRANDVVVSDDWSDAYYARFSGGSGEGSAPLVISYATSPAAEYYFAEGAVDEPPTLSLDLPGAVFRQIEFVGILKGTPREAAARKLVDFMLSPPFQADIPLQMFVYPADPATTLPDFYTQFAAVPQNSAVIDPAAIDAGRERWIEEWTEIVLR